MLESFQPDFEKRASAFTHEVQAAIDEIKRKDHMPRFDISVEDPLHQFMDAYDALASVVGDKMDGDETIETPVQASQRLDQQSAHEAIVRIYGEAEFKKMLVDLVNKTKELAKKYGGEPSNFMSLLQTSDAKDGIENLGAEGEYLWQVHLNYSFK